MFLYICVYLKKVSIMSITINGVSLNRTHYTEGTKVNGAESEALFTGEAQEAKETNFTLSNEEVTRLEAEIAELETKLATLETQKAQKEAYKKELEAAKRALEAQKEAIINQIEQNEEEIQHYKDVIEQNEQNIEKAQKEIERLEQEYNEKNKEAQELSDKIDEKIAQIVEDSEEEADALEEKIKNATEEANEKVKSGELDESEVGQYIAQKVGAASTSASAAQFASIYTMNNQLYSLVNGSNDILSQICTQQNLINGYKGNIEAATNSINEIVQSNIEYKEQLDSLNEQIDAGDIPRVYNWNEIYEKIHKI